MKTKTEIFNDSKADTYRKKQLVKAFQFSVNGETVTFCWDGWRQTIQASGVLLIGLDENMVPAGDPWGCATTEFNETYEEVSPSIYRKKAKIRAYQPGYDFKVSEVTTKDGNVEVEDKFGNSKDWIVRNVGGGEKDAYLINEDKFRSLEYVKV